MSLHCQTCSCDDPSFVPPEPPVGSWVKDRFGATHKRMTLEGWGTPGFYASGRWAAMWAARGPLTPCDSRGNPIDGGAA